MSEAKMMEWDIAVVFWRYREYCESLYEQQMELRESFSEADLLSYAKREQLASEMTTRLLKLKKTRGEAKKVDRQLRALLENYERLQQEPKHELPKLSLGKVKH
jgi:predicted glycosyl hydrolase (DUF1957 family)